MKKQYVVIGTNPDLNAFAWGTPTGKLFESRLAADKAAKQISNTYENLNGTVVLEIKGWNSNG